jgi:hypothetical protein
MDQTGSTTLIGPVVLALFAAADVLRPRFPTARWHMWYPAMACGMVNAVSSDKGSAITCMITGHSAPPAPRALRCRPAVASLCVSVAANHELTLAPFLLRLLSCVLAPPAVMNLSSCLAALISKGPSAQIASVAKQSAGIR